MIVLQLLCNTSNKADRLNADAVQFSSKVTFGCIRNACRTRLRLVKKGHGTHVSLAAALLQGFALVQTHLLLIPDAYHACPSHVLPTFQTFLVCVSDVFERYLGAELYHTSGITGFYLYACLKDLIMVRCG